MWVHGQFVSTCLPGQAAYPDKPSLTKKEPQKTKTKQTVTVFFFSESPIGTQIIGYTDVGSKYKFDLKWNY